MSRGVNKIMINDKTKALPEIITILIIYKH